MRIMQRSPQADGSVAGPPPHSRAFPFLSHGFRPFFLGAAVWAVISMAIWLGALADLWPLAEDYGAVAWHAHELLFGYAVAVVAGFLLTAVPNWTGRLPVAGWPLLLLFLLWCTARIGFLVTGVVGLLAVVVIDSLFLPSLLLLMAREIAAGRNWRNLKPLALVGLLAAANIAFHVEVLSTGAPNVASRLGIAALIGLIMLIGGRIVPSFTRNWLSRTGSERLPASFGSFDIAALLFSGVALFLWILWPTSTMTGVIFFIAACLQGVRLWRWSGAPTWREPLVLILHLGYAFVPFGFLLGAIAIGSPGALGGTAALHAWTVGAVGVMTLAVMTRATRGHTGRLPTASRLTIAVYAAILAAALLRIAAGITPWLYLALIDIAGVAWTAAFAMFLIEYAPMLVGSRLERGVANQSEDVAP